jgi:hypothetical protein
VQRYLLAIGHAGTGIDGATPIDTLEKLAAAVAKASVAHPAEKPA